jgi:hypothetical protein
MRDNEHVFYVIGTIDTLYFIETVNGNNVSLTNVTVPTGTQASNFSVNVLFNDVSNEFRQMTECTQPLLTC